MNATRLSLAAAATLLLAADPVSGQTTIDPTNQYAYAANAGWVGMRGDTTNGVVIGEYVCSGYAYAANVGWINFGSGTAANGVYYQNNTATDFGVNLQPDGRLRGFAYGANIGWINFEANGDPKVDIVTGKLTGYAYGANIGWIDLGTNVNVNVVTTKIKRGLSTAGDGVPDAWKIQNFGAANNPLAAAGADPDGDGLTNLQEYRDGTDPNNRNSVFALTSFTKTGTTLSLSWTSVPLRFYVVEYNSNLNPGTFADVGFGVLPSNGGPTMSTPATITDANAQGFYRVRAQQTLLLQP